MEHYSLLCMTSMSLLLLVVWQNVLATEINDCSCYSFQEVKRNWEESNNYCKQMNGNLVSMETEEEYHFINKTIQNLNVSDNEWYIGLKRTHTWSREHWHWTSGQSLNFDKWVSGEPSRTHADCVKMIKHYNGLGLFDDVRCTEHYMSICEYKTVQTCPSNTRKWCHPSFKNKLTTTTNDYITTTTFSTTTKEITTTATPASSTSSTTTTTTQRKDSTHPITNKKSTENGRQTPVFIQTTKPEAPKANVSFTIENERATGPTQKIGDTNSPQSRSSGTSPFPLVIVTVALGVVLAVSLCLLFFVCYWKKRNRGENIEKPKSETTSLPRDAIEQASNSNQGLEDGGSSAEGVQLFHQNSGQSYVTYAVIQNNLTQEGQGPSTSNEPAYTSIEDDKMVKRSSRKNGQNAAMPPAQMNAENSGNSVGGGKSKTEALYASIDKSKKNNIKKESQLPSNQQVVYASVDKSKKLSKARPEDVVYAEVGNKENTEKQQPYHITYAELADFNKNATEEAVKPAPYKPAEYAVIIPQEQKS